MVKAFPNVTGQAGMDLRDYFAAAALQELMKVALDENIPKEKVAELAYAIADAMMKAREEK